MRLLKAQGSDLSGWQPQLVDFRGEDYAILSHRWAANANDEVLFVDIEIIDDGGRDPTTGHRPVRYVFNPGYSQRSPQCKPGFHKLMGAAQQALRDGYEFIWVDTCCIDKSSSAELSEAINSMWTWYSKSTICYAYLQDVPGGPDGTATNPESRFAQSQWWTRGWTLQELLAPLDVVFFTETWDPIGEKKSLSDAIVAVTGIGIDVLTHARRMESVSIARRMSWASHRKTTRVEDLAYSLMGIFSVNMPHLYGEGERAFLRLQQEITKDSDDESIFAWVESSANPDSYSGLLAKHPSAFARSSDIIYYRDFEYREPYVMSNRGLSITLHLSPVQDGTVAAALHCPVPQSGDGFLAVYLKQLGKDSQHYARVKCGRLGALDIRGALETIYIRQSHPTHELDTVLPYHFFSLRHLHTGDAPEEKYVLENAKCDPLQRLPYTALVSLPITKSSHARRWVRGIDPVFRLIRGTSKLSALLLFASAGEDSDSSRVLIMLGSISSTQVGYDAREFDTGGLATALQLEDFEPDFRPRPAGNWIELENHHVRVEIEPQVVDGSNQLFITDITISRIIRVTPLQALGEAVVDRLEPFVPMRLPTIKKPPTRSKKIWQRLGRNG